MNQYLPQPNARDVPPNAPDAPATAAPAGPVSRASAGAGAGADKFPVVALCGSAGSLNAFEQFFGALPARPGLAFVVVMHLGATPYSQLPQVLQNFTPLPVAEATNGLRVRPDHVYVIPPDADLSLLRGCLFLLPPTQPVGHRLPIDSFLHALAKDVGARAVCIICSGLGADGSAGLKAVMENFGLVVAQDPATAAFDAMPRAALATEFVDFALAPGQMPAELLAYAARLKMPGGQRLRLPPDDPNAQPAHALQKIFLLIRQRTGHDFSFYKRNTVFRRIERRMNAHKISEFTQYVRYLQHSPAEVEQLFRELLIGVTKFFRDAAAFESLQGPLQQLVLAKEPRGTVRVWAPGCSTGEEVYSLAMLLLECLDAVGHSRGVQLQLFATDISPDAIDFARAGRYPAAIAADVAPERLTRFFSPADGHYQIRKEVRDAVVFALHDVNKDAPFTKLDLLCCRNLLIYLNAELQKNLLPVFHYALRPGGILFLGPSENLASVQDLFQPLDGKWKISRRLETSAAPARLLNFPFAMSPQPPAAHPAAIEGLVGAVPSDDPHAPAACRLALTDVTARRQAADALAASEARFRATFEQSHDGQALLHGLHLVDANAGALRLLGQSDKSQVLGRRLADFWPDDQPGGQSLPATLLACAQQAHAQGWCRHELRRYAAGQPVWDELSFHPVVVQGEALLHLTWRDVTDRQLGQQRLRESEEHLQLALTASATGVWGWDLATGLVEQDACAQQVLGTAAPRVPWADLHATVHPADRPGLDAALHRARTTRGHFELEHRLVRADGDVRHVAAAGRFVYDAATGRPLRMAGLVRDVTAPAQAREALRFQNRLLANILQNLPVVLARLAPDGRYRALQGAGLHRLGLADGDLVGQVAAERFPQGAAQIARLLAGHSDSHVATCAHEGQPVHFLTYGFWDADYQEGIRFSIDVTESEVLKQAAARQQQVLLAAVLAAQEEERRRIAEALHNGMGQLLYATRLHLDTLPPSAAVQAGQSLLNEAIRAVRTMAFELTPGVLEDLGLPGALRELARRIPPAQLAIDLNLSNLDEPLPASLAIAVYRAVQELLNNVMKHARAREVFVQVAREGPAVHLSVEDDGVGFDAAAPGGAQGLGLAGIRTRAELLGGTLTIRARPGQGTGVFLVLPVA